jgi:hypothetical protein
MEHVMSKKNAFSFIFFTIIILVFTNSIYSQDYQSRISKHSINLGDTGMQLEGYLGHYVYSSGVGNDQFVIGWDHLNRSILRYYDMDFNPVGRDLVLRDYILQDIQGLEDGSVLVLGIYHPDESVSLANAFRSPLAMHLIKISPNRQIEFNTRLVGGEGIDDGKTWYAWMPSIASADVAYNGREYGVFLEVSHNFGASGVHQTDLFLKLDENGRIIEGSRQFQYVSHSNELHIVDGANDEFVTITVGDAYPFGFTFVNRESGAYEVIWPQVSQNEQSRMVEENKYTTGAGGIDRFLRFGNNYYAITNTHENLPIDYMNGDNRDVLFFQLNSEGEIIHQNWLTRSSVPIDKSFAAPYGLGILVGYVFYEDELEGIGSMNLIELGLDGSVLSRSTDLQEVEAYYHSYFFNFPDGSVGWTIARSSTEVDIYRIGY